MFIWGILSWCLLVGRCQIYGQKGKKAYLFIRTMVFFFFCAIEKGKGKLKAQSTKRIVGIFLNNTDEKALINRHTFFFFSSLNNSSICSRPINFPEGKLQFEGGKKRLCEQ